MESFSLFLAKFRTVFFFFIFLFVKIVIVSFSFPVLVVENISFVNEKSYERTVAIFTRRYVFKGRKGLRYRIVAQTEKVSKNNVGRAQLSSVPSELKKKSDLLIVKKYSKFLS